MVTEEHAAGALDGSVDPEELTTLLSQENQELRAEIERLQAENTALRRDAEFFRFIEDCPIRTGVVLGRLAHEEGFDLRAECERVMALVAKRKAMTKEQP